MEKKSDNGMDKNKRWGNSAMKGHGVNSPAMMEARKSFSKKHELAKKMVGAREKDRMSGEGRHQITEERLKYHWSTGKPLNYKGSQHSVNRMSYGDYFLREKRKGGLGGGKEHWMERTGEKKNVNEKGSRLTKENTKGGRYQRHYSEIYKERD